jgi:hypothetical protein
VGVVAESSKPAVLDTFKYRAVLLGRMRDRWKWAVGGVLIVVIIIILVSIDRSPKVIITFNESNATVKIRDIEKASFGTIDDYRGNTGQGDAESLTFGLKRPTGESAELGTQIIRSATKEETQNLWEVHVQNIRDTPFVKEKDIPVGEKGKIFKLTLPDDDGPKTFYLIFYQNQSFVILTMNYAKESDEPGLVQVAQNIEKGLK